MKRKTLALLLGLVMVVGLSACGDTTEPATDESGNETQTQANETKAEKNEFSIGETWTVDGLWEVTVTGVTETDYRNSYDDRSPAAVYIVDYTYKNIGYEDSNGIMDGLFISLDSSIIDNAGVMGYSYPGDVNYYAQETPVGATCNAQSCIGVDNAGSFKLNLDMYDGNGTEYEATFLVDVE